MEEKNDSAAISDREFLALLHAARKNDAAAMMQFVELFKSDIVHVSKFIHMPKEEAEAQIILEFLEFVKYHHDEEFHSP